MMASIESRVVKISFVGLCVAALTFAESVAAQSERSVQHRVPADYMSFRGAQWLEREARVDQEQPEKVLEAMSLGAGDVVEPWQPVPQIGTVAVGQLEQLVSVTQL